MFKGSLIGIGVTLLLLMIPVVHFVSGPLGPFIGGFIGGSKAEVVPKQAFALGGLMGFFMAVPAGITIALNSMAPTLLPDGARDILFLISVGVMIYTAIFGTLGALAGGHMARRQHRSEESTKKVA